MLSLAGVYVLYWVVWFVMMVVGSALPGHPVRGGGAVMMLGLVGGGVLLVAAVAAAGVALWRDRAGRGTPRSAIVPA